MEKPERISSLTYPTSGSGGPSWAETLPKPKGRASGRVISPISGCPSSFQTAGEESLPANLPFSSGENKEHFCSVLPPPPPNFAPSPSHRWAIAWVSHDTYIGALISFPGEGYCPNFCSNLQNISTLLFPTQVTHCSSCRLDSSFPF